MITRYRSAAVAVAALMLTSGIVYAAGKFSTLPIVGGSSYCASTVTGTGSLSGVTGQGQGTTGSICGETVPAGPSIVTGNEVIPADLYRPDQAPGSLGAQPQTALLSLASLNALPLTVTTVTGASQTIAAAATSGGVFAHLGAGQGAAMTAVTIDFPPAPIDDQHFAVSGDASITTLTLTALNLPANVKISLAPTSMTATNAVLFGYQFVYSAALNQWGRLQ
jgi:hypothetical protein